MKTLAPLVAGAAALVLAGCGPEPEPGRGGEAPGSDPLAGTLDIAGSVLRGPLGFGVSVPAGVLDAPLAVELRRVEAPAPLPDGWTAHGPAFQITAGRDVPSDGDVTGFVLALPVPDGVPLERLGVAAHLPAGASLDVPGATWIALRTQLARAERLLLVRAPSLGATPRILQVAGGEELDARPAAPPPPGAASTLRQGLTSDLAWAAGFEVEAAGSPAPAAAWVAFYETVLDDALQRHRDAAFVPFALEYAGLDLWFDPPSIVFRETPRYAVEVRSYRNTQLADAPCEISPQGILHGTYDPTWETLTLCAAAGGVDDPELATRARDTTFHELFHAEQARFFSTPMLQDHRWFTEGTATLAQSLQASARPVRAAAQDPRSVAVSLLSEERSATYEAQDFWAAVARRHDLTLEGLVAPFFLGGDLAPEAVASTFAAPPFAEGLAVEYGHFVETQLFDRESCTFRDEAAGDVTSLGELVYAVETPTEPPVPTSLRLGPLTARVLSVEAANVRPRPVALEVELSGAIAGSEGSLRVARVDVGGACTLLRGERSGSVHVARTTLEPGDQARLHVIAGNGAHAGERDGVVRLREQAGCTGERVFARTAADLQRFTGATVLDVSLSVSGDAVAALDVLANVSEAACDLAIAFPSPVEDLRALSALRTVAGRLSLTGPIASLRGLEGLQSAGGLVLGGLTAASLAGLEGLDGALTLLELSSAPALSDVSALSGLTEAGALSLVETPALATLAAFARLSCKGACSLTITGTALTSLEGLQSFAGVSRLHVSGNARLQTLEPLVLPAQVDQVAVQENPALASLGSVARAQAIGNLGVTANAALEVLDLELASLRYSDDTPGTLTVTGNGALRELGMSGLTGPAAGVWIEGNAQLPSIALGLESLQSLLVDANDALTVIGMPSLTRIDQGLFIRGNASLATLDFPALVEAGGPVEIDRNPALPGDAVRALMEQIGR